MTAAHDAARRLPHSSEIERSVLGGLLVDPTRLIDVRGVLTPAEFHRPQHQEFYRALLELADTRGGYDLELVLDWIAHQPNPERFGGIDYVVALPNACPSPESIELHAVKLRDYAVRRRLILACWATIDEVTAGVEDVVTLTAEAERRLNEASDLALVAEPEHVGSGVVAEALAIGERGRERALAEARGEPFSVGLTSGYPALDSVTGGMGGGQLVILAARPAMGKTALALNLAVNALSAGAAVCIFSLEMTKKELYRRMFASIGRVWYDRIESARTDRQDQNQIDKAAEWLAGRALFVDDQPSLPLAQLIARARRLHRRHPLGLIMIDYLQLVRGPQRKGANLAEIVGEVSGALKGLSKDLDVPVVALSQLNRECEKRTDKRPMVSDLRDSGSLEQDADKVLFIYRDEVYNTDSADRGIAEIVTAKNRAGKTGTARLSWLGGYQRFESVEG